MGKHPRSVEFSVEALVIQSRLQPVKNAKSNELTLDAWSASTTEPKKKTHMVVDFAPRVAPFSDEFSMMI